MNRKKPRVLVVEDEMRFNAALCALFQYWEYDTVDAFTCADAVERLAIPFDLVVIDLMLPDCDGSQVIKVIRDRALECVVAVSTAMPSDAHPVDNVRALAPEYLLFKPMVVDDLQAIAHRVKVAFRAARNL